MRTARVFSPRSTSQAVERPGHGAHRVLVERDPVGQVLEAGTVDGRAATTAPPTTSRVAAAVLGGGVHDHVGAERERLLQVRRRERVVDRRAARRPRARSRPAPRCRRCRAAGWWASRPRRPSSDRDGSPRAPRRGREIERDGVLHAPRPRDLVEQPVGAAVRVVGDDGVVARARAARGAACPGRPARRRTRSRGAVLERGQALLERGPGRVGRAGVLVAAAQAADAVLLVRRHLVDRRDDRAGRAGPAPAPRGWRGWRSRWGREAGRASSHAARVSRGLARDGLDAAR